VYASLVRRLLALAALALSLGCRAPSIPAQPSPREYALLGDWVEQTGSTLPPQVSLVIDTEALVPSQREMQFQQCLPPRMQAIFNTAAPATLASSSGNDWLRLSDGRSATLHPNGATLSFTRPTQIFRVSRVAFTRSGYEAFLWVEHQTCQADPAHPGCEGLSGALLHAHKSDGAWTFEETTCQAIVFPT